jgi:peptidyl-prolyl cis-trans isomerase C
MTQMRPDRFLIFFVWILFPFSFCHAAEQGTADPILATVNGVKITQNDFDEALEAAQKNGETHHATEDFKSRVLNELIELILIEKSLISDGQMENPKLVSDLKLSRLATLKRFFLAHSLGPMRTITVAEADKFAADHPDFFANRKTYSYVDLKIEREPRLDVARIKAMVMMANKRTSKSDPAEHHSIQEILAYLGATNINYTQFQGFRSSEQIQESLLNDLKSLPPGQLVVNTDSDKRFVHVILLRASAPDPMDPIQARGQIAKGILMQEASEKTKTILEDLKRKADIHINANEPSPKKTK